MVHHKTYGQFCAVARALDHVGDRWTLLVVRELLLGPRTFRELERSLEGISPNLLVERLRALGLDGLVERNQAPARSKHVTYSLTPQGADLEPVMLELIRWGARYMLAGPGNDRSDPRWATLAVRALLDGPSVSAGRPGLVQVDIDGYALTIVSDGRSRRVLTGSQGIADATVNATLPELLAVAAGVRPWTVLLANTEGDTAVLEAALTHEQFA